jgi:hypothetical protein
VIVTEKCIRGLIGSSGGVNGPTQLKLDNDRDSEEVDRPIMDQPKRLANVIQSALSSEPIRALKAAMAWYGAH